MITTHVQALLNPTWACPPCRGFCNCSICRFGFKPCLVPKQLSKKHLSRDRKGKGATGILILIAQSKGYDNVADYLEALQTKKAPTSLMRKRMEKWSRATMR